MSKRYADMTEEQIEKERARKKAWRKLNPEKCYANTKRYRQNHPEKVKEQDKRKREKHKKEIRAIQKKWIQNNKERKKAHRKKWNENNPEKVKEYHARWNREHSEIRNANKRRWDKNHPDSTLARARRRYAKKKGQTKHFDKYEWKLLCEQYDNRCLRCGEKKPLTADHVMPLSLGGRDTIDNIQPLCRNCNSSKNAKYIDYRNRAPIKIEQLSFIEIL